MKDVADATGEQSKRPLINDILYFVSENFRAASSTFCLAVLLALSAQAIRATPQDVVVTVRLINARSGRPLRRIGVALSLWRQAPALKPDTISSAGHTNGHGDVQLRRQPLCQSADETVLLSLSTPWSPAGRGGPLSNANLQLILPQAKTSGSDQLGLSAFNLTTDIDGKISLPASIICRIQETYIKLHLAEEPSGQALERIYVYARGGTSKVRREVNVPRPEEMIPPPGSILPETDARGIVSFHVDAKSLPPYVSVGPFSTQELRNCSSETFTLDQVLRTGVIATYDVKRCGKLQVNPITPIPGEIVIYDRVFSRWDWFLQELP